MYIFIIALVFLLGVVAGCASTALYYQRKALEARVADLESQAEEIEHATAAFILLQNEMEFKQSLMDNLGAHLLKARENKRVSP